MMGAFTEGIFMEDFIRVLQLLVALGGVLQARPHLIFLVYHYIFHDQILNHF